MKGYWLGFLFVLSVALTGFWVGHDVSFLLTDDAIYMYGAEQILNGGGPGTKSGPSGGGYAMLPNVGALAVFGDRLLSLRYPLLLVLLVLSLGAYHILAKDSRLQGILAGVVVATLTVTQYMNPASSWYAIALVMCAALWLEHRETLNRVDFALLGFLVGAVFFIRQLNGILLGAGVLMAVLPQLGRQLPSRQRLLGRLMLISVGIVLIFMTFRAQAIGSWLLVALAPTLLFCMLWRDLMLSNRLAMSFILLFILGFAVSTVPLVLWRLFDGTLVLWLQNFFVRSVAFSWADYFPAARLSAYPLYLLEGLMLRPDLGAVLNAVYWLGLLLQPTLLGALLYRMARAGWSVKMRPFALIALFHGVSLLHHQLLIYVYFVAAFCLVGVLQITTHRASFAGGVPAMFAVALIVVGVGWHQGKAAPLSEAHMLWGDRSMPLIDCNIERSGLRMTASDCERYTSLLSILSKRLGSDGSLLTIPNNIELNVFTGREQPVLGHNCAMSLRTKADVDQVLVSLQRQLPSVVVVDPTNEYFSELCRDLAFQLTETYVGQEAPAPYQVYVLEQTEN